MDITVCLGEEEGITYYLTGRRVHSESGDRIADFLSVAAVGHATEKKVPNVILMKARKILRERENHARPVDRAPSEGL